MEAFTHKYNTFKHTVDKVRIFAHNYNTFKYIGDKVIFLHTISSSLMYVKGNTQNQALETGSNHSVLASTVRNIEHC